MLDSQRQDIAAGTLKAGDDRNAEWIGALESARWPKPDARSVCRAARRFAHGTAICLRKPERSGELVDGDGWASAARTPRASPDAPPTTRQAPTMATRGRADYISIWWVARKTRISIAFPGIGVGWSAC